MLSTRSARLRSAGTSLLLFAVVAALYLAIRVDIRPTDTSWTVHTSLSLLREGNLDLNEYPYAAGDPNGVMDLDGRLISFFPLATPILITPAVAAADALLRPSLDLYDHLQRGADWLLIARLNLTLASLITAGTAVVMHRALRRLHGAGVALIVSLVFAFGTMMWSTASRDLWQHTLSTLTLALTLYLLVVAREDDRMAQFAGLTVALAYTIRPTNSISVIGITLYVFLAHRRFLLRYLGWAAVVAVAFIALNLNVFGGILPPYFLSSRLAIHPAFLQALAGNLISPGRGLLVYAPVLLFAAYGFGRRLISRTFTGLDWTLAGIVLAHWLAISAFWHWWGGASYGPRFFTDMLPFLTYFLGYGVAAITQQRRGARVGLGVAFAVVAALSVAIHARGVADERVWAWNGENLGVTPSVDAAPARVWDWRDAPFARGLRGPEMRVDPVELRLSASEGAQVTSSVTATIRNVGDRPFVWDVDLPRRLSRQPAEQQVRGLGYSEVALTADVAGLVRGCHALGAAQFRAQPEDAWGASAVVPVVAAVGGGDAGAAGGCSLAAADLLVDGRQQDDSGALRAFFGSGWYDMEGAPPDTWRWTESPAQLLIYSSRATKVRLESVASSLYDPQRGAGEERGVLRVSVGGKTEAAPVAVAQPFSVQLDLRSGWNDVRLELDAGNFRPVDRDPATGDTRTLSFALGTTNLARQP